MAAFSLHVTGQKIQELLVAFKINDDVVQQTKALKLLGVTIDDKLTFKEHISNRCTKASQRVGVLIRLRNQIPIDAKLRPLLEHFSGCMLKRVPHLAKALMQFINVHLKFR